MMMLFLSLAWNNIGHVDWEPWFAQVSGYLSQQFEILLVVH